MSAPFDGSIFMDYNYHAHTYRCSHATGTPEEYVLRALQNGIRYMGFSDHIPFRCDDGFEDLHVRVPMADGEAYIQELRQLREKYRGQIELAIGFETEYYPAISAPWWKMPDAGARNI